MDTWFIGPAKAVTGKVQISKVSDQSPAEHANTSKTDLGLRHKETLGFSVAASQKLGAKCLLLRPLFLLIAFGSPDSGKLATAVL